MPLKQEYSGTPQTEDGQESAFECVVLIVLSKQMYGMNNLTVVKKPYWSQTTLCNEQTNKYCNEEPYRSE